MNPPREMPSFRATLLTPKPGHPKARTSHGVGPRPGQVPLIRLTVERMPSGLHNFDDSEECPKRAAAIDEYLQRRLKRNG